MTSIPIRLIPIPLGHAPDPVGWLMIPGSTRTSSSRFSARAFVERDHRLDLLARLRKYAAPTAELDALFAEVDETIKERNESSRALELGPVIGVGEVKLLWFSVALHSQEHNEDDVPWIQGSIRVDSRNTNWFSVSVSTVESHARGRSTHFSNDRALHDDVALGRCEPDGMPRWLASAATRLSIAWQPFLPTSNLRTKRLARIANWLACR